jgi:hypothetical protein
MRTRKIKGIKYRKTEFMKAKIALATVSGKAYYKLVSELKQRDISFLSLMPRDPLPLTIKVVITTEKERHLVKHPNVLVFNEETDATPIVNEAIKTVQGKKNYEKVVVGVDPGKTVGLAILGDENVLETLTCSSLEETVNSILRMLEKPQAINNRVKIGNGAPLYTKQLLDLLDEALPEEVGIEIVSEEGTSRFGKETVHRRDVKDVMSAIRIAGRKGSVFHRKKK